MKIRCAHCGQALELEEVPSGRVELCPVCGNLIVRPGPQSSGSHCPKCNASMAETAVLCVNCGFNRKTGRFVTQDTRRQSPRNKALPMLSGRVFRIGCGALCLLLISGGGWFVYEKIDRSSDIDAFREVEYACRFHHVSHYMEHKIQSPRDAVEKYLSVRPSGRFRKEVENQFFSLCFSSFAPKNAPGVLSDRILQFREVFPQSPRIADGEKILCRRLQSRCRPDLLDAYFVNFPNGSLRKEVSASLERQVRSTVPYHVCVHLKALIGKLPLVKWHALYTLLLFRELAAEEDAEARYYANRVVMFFKKHEKFMATVPEKPSEEFVTLLDLRDAWKRNVPEGYMEYLRKYGLSRPGRRVLLYWLTESACGKVYEVKDPVKSFMILGNSPADSPEWNLYVLCQLWNGKPSHPRIILSLDFTEQKFVDRTVTRIPYRDNLWIALEKPVPIHKSHGKFTFRCGTPAGKKLLLQESLSVTSSPDLPELANFMENISFTPKKYTAPWTSDLTCFPYRVVSDGGKNVKVTFSSGILERKSMNYYHCNEVADAWRSRVLDAGGKNAIQTLPPQPEDLLRLLLQLEKPTTPEHERHNGGLLDAARRISRLSKPSPETAP